MKKTKCPTNNNSYFPRSFTIIALAFLFAMASLFLLPVVTASGSSGILPFLASAFGTGTTGNTQFPQGAQDPAEPPTPLADIVWTGNGTTNNWSEAANWSTNAVPGINDRAIFNATSTEDAVIDVDVTIQSMNIEAGYSGSISQGASALTLVNGLYTQADGHFVGGSGPLIFPLAFTLSGGTFTASSGTTSFGFTFNQTGGIWNANGGTVAFVSNFDFNITAPPAIEFNDVVVNLGNNLTRMGVSFNTTAIVNGTLTFISGQLTSSGFLEARGDVFIPANHTSIEGGNLRFAGDAVRTITIPSGAQLSDLEINAPNTTISTSGTGLVTLGSVQLINAAEFTNAAADLEVRPSRNWNQSGGTFAAGSGSLTFRNFFTLSGGTFTGDSSPISFTVNTFTLSGGTFTASSGTTSFGSSFTKTGGTWDANGGTVAFVGSGDRSISANAPGIVDFHDMVVNLSNNLSRLQVSFQTTAVVNGSLSFVSGRLGSSTGTLEARGAVLFQADHISNEGGNLRFAGDAARTITIPAGAELPNLEINAPNTTINTSGTGLITVGTVQLTDVAKLTNGGADLQQRTGAGQSWTQSGGTFVAGSGSLTFPNTYTHSGGSFTGSDSAIRIGSAFTLSGGSFTASSGTTSFQFTVLQNGGTWNDNGGTVVFDGNFGGNITVLPGTEFSDLTVNKATSTTQFSIASTLVVNGEVSLVRGQLGRTLEGELRIHGDLVVQEEMSNTPSGPHVRFVGTADQSFANFGGFNPSGIWTIDKPAGDLLLLSDLDLSNALGFFPLNLISGKIVTGDFTVFAGVRFIERTEGYIDGNLRRTIDGTGVKQFPIGTSSGFTPVSVNVTALGQNPSQLLVGAVNGPHPRLDPAASLGRYWRLTETGDLTATLTFNYLNDDVIGDESAYRVHRIGENTLTIFQPPTAIIDTVANTATITGVSDFSDWTLAAPAQPVSIAPQGQTVPPGSTVQFNAIGGYPPFTFALFQNNSGADFDPATQIYTAGTTLGAQDVVRVTDSFGFTSDSTVTVNVIPTRVVLTVQPTNATAGAAIAPAIRAELQDDLGNVAGLSSAPITLSIANNPAGGSLFGNTTRNAVNGVVHFDDIFIDRAAEGYTLSASSAGLTADTSSAFNITPGPAARLGFGVQPSDVPPFEPINPPVEVRVEDQFGNLVPTATNPVSVAIGANPGGGTLSGTLTRNASGGIAVFDDLSIDIFGEGYTLTSVSDGLAGIESTSFEVLNPLTVTNTNDSGFGSLRFAIQSANATPKPETISFNIPGPGPHIITVESDLPAITHTATIDGTSQTGYDDRPLVALTRLASNQVSRGLEMTGLCTGCVIQGLSIYGFNAGIIARAENTVIRANFIGLDLSGDDQDGQGNRIGNTTGIFLIGSGSIVGGVQDADRNVISGNTFTGMRVVTSSEGKRVEGNYIGTDPSGLLARGNGTGGIGSGVQILRTNIDTPESRHLFLRNVISGNSGHGIVILSTQGNAPIEIKENLIGLNALGDAVIGNSRPGILNLSDRPVEISQNRIFGNTGKGISLTNSEFSPKPNVPGASFNRPVLNVADIVDTALNIKGSLNTPQIPGTQYRLEFFSSPSCQATLQGQGFEYLGSTMIAGNQSGISGFDVVFPAVEPGRFITATSTDLQTMTTSEFSNCSTVAVAADRVFVTGTVRDDAALPLSSMFLVTNPLFNNNSSTLTKSDGTYRLEIPRASQETVTVKPLSSFLAFSPTERTYVNTTSNQTGQDFLGFEAGTLEGRVFSFINGGRFAVSGIRIDITGPLSLSQFTDANGLYRFPSLPAGTYTVSAVGDGYSFVPPSQQVTIVSSANRIANFDAIPFQPPTGRIAIAHFNQISLMNADGSGTSGIPTRYGYSVQHSTDGSKLTWQESPDGAPGGLVNYLIMTANHDGSDKKVFDSSTSAWLVYPAWSPDGTLLAYISLKRTIVIRNVSDGSLVRQFQVPFDYIWELQWAANDRLVFTAWLNDSLSRTIIASIESNGTGISEIASSPSFNYGRPRVSPDGTKLLFGRRTISDRFSAFSGISGNGTTSIMTANINGSGQTELPVVPERYDQIAWSPDGTWIGVTIADGSLIASFRIINPLSGLVERSFEVPSGRISWGPSFSPQTPTGTNVTVESGTATVTFGSVTSPGETTVVPISPESAGKVPVGFSAGKYGAWDVSTTASVAPPITVCFTLTDFIDSEAIFNKISIFHNENGVMVNRTSSRDFATKTICATVNSLSPFVLAEEIDASLPSITGLVLDDEGGPMVGVPVALSGTEAHTIVTGSDGLFSFVNLTANGSYNVRPSKLGYLFEEYSVNFVEITAEETVVFTGTPAEFSVSGRVVNFSGNGVPGIEIVVDGSGFDLAVTDADGSFSLTGLPADGSFTVRALSESFSFLPNEIAVDPLVGDVTGLEFTAFAPTSAPVSISGRVLTPDGRGISNTRVIVIGMDGQLFTAHTNSFGYYFVEGLQSGAAYTVTAAGKGMQFDTIIVNADQDLTDVNLVALAIEAGAGGR
jgi:hypothetical protein